MSEREEKKHPMFPQFAGERCPAPSENDVEILKSDRRLLTRFLIARDAGLLQIELGKVEKELEESGYLDIKKELDDDLKRKIRAILRG